MPQNDPLAYGPFSNYLTEPVYPQQQAPISGYQGKGATSLMLIDQFLKGVSRGRAANFQKQELQRKRYEDNLRSLAQFTERGPYRREVKENVLQQIAGALFNESRVDMAQAKNPLAKIFDQVVGPAPKKIDDGARFQVVSNVMSMLGSPDARLDVQKLSGDYLNTVKSVAEEGKRLKPAYSMQDAMADQRVIAARGQMEREGIDLKSYDPMVQNILSSADLINRAPAWSRERLVQDAISRTTTGQPPSAPSQSPGETVSLTEPPTPPGARRLTPDEELLGVLSEVQNYVDPSTGKPFTGGVFKDILGRTSIVDVSTKMVVPGARQALASDLKKYTPGQVEASRTSLTAAIKAMKSSDEANYLLSINNHLQIGDVDGATRVFDSFVRAEESKGNREANRNAAQFQRNFTNELSLTAQMNSDKEFAGFLAARDSMDQINAAYKRSSTDSTGVSDLTLLRSIAKMTDRLTGVREGEYATFESAIGALTKFGVAVSRGWFTGQKLTPEGRAAFYRISKDIYDRAESGYRHKLGQYQRIAERHGIPVPAEFIRPSRLTDRPSQTGTSGTGQSPRTNPHRRQNVPAPF